MTLNGLELKDVSSAVTQCDDFQPGALGCGPPLVRTPYHHVLRPDTTPLSGASLTLCTLGGTG